MTRNVAASVHQRLLNYARTKDRPFNEVLQRFALERFLYRLGKSVQGRRFILKGALMLTAWKMPFSRPTRDIDLLGFIENTVDQVVSAIQAICHEPVVEDGLRFAAKSVVGEQIIEAANYSGVRLRFNAFLGQACIPIRVDVGFGDPLVPGSSSIKLPTILDFPPPELQGYSRESAIAEKYQCMVYLGQVNSRMKDFFDIWSLSTHFAFEGLILARAIQETFRWRGTLLTPDPVVFTNAFAQDNEKQMQWQAFFRRLYLNELPITWHETIEAVSAFLQPVTQALVEGYSFDKRWVPGGPWTPQCSRVIGATAQ